MAGFISPADAAEKISTIGKGALDTLASQGCMEEQADCENSRAKLLVVIRDSQEVKYKLREDATADQHFLFHAAWDIGRLMRHQNSPEFLARCDSYFAGLQTGMYLALAGDTLNNALLKQFNATTARQIKGLNKANQMRQEKTAALKNESVERMNTEVRKHPSKRKAAEEVARQMAHYENAPTVRAIENWYLAYERCAPS
jgi:hypothetical protein